MKYIRNLILLLLLLACAVLSACGNGYRSVSAERAAEIMEEEHDCTVLDIRLPEAFAEGHLPDALNLPLDTLSDTAESMIPEKKPAIILYGNGAGDTSDAASLLVSLGYERVLVLGGFALWTGDTVTEEDPEHICVFSEKKPIARYFVMDATKNQATVFRYSCTCGEPAHYKTFTHGKTTSERTDAGKNASSVLDGKKILFAGGASNIYGKLVINKAASVTDQASRMGDTGYFYELCKQNGVTVDVTNWSFDGHDLADLFGTSCDAGRGCEEGHDHLADLVDRNYDYVYMSDIRRSSGISEESYIEEIKSYMKIFTDVNPNCKFIFSIPVDAYWYNHQSKLGAYDYVKYAQKLTQLDNVIVADPGRLLYDLSTREALVPDTSVRGTESTFLTPDCYPNLLGGYMTALMTYCLITEETAVSQPISLENDTETGTALRLRKSSYVDKIYKGKSTNFLDILNSESEMQAIQQMIDRYIDMETYLYYEQ